MATNYFFTNAAPGMPNPTGMVNTIRFRLMSLSRGPGVVTQTDATVATLGTSVASGSLVAAVGSGTGYGQDAGHWDYPNNSIIWVTPPLNAFTIAASPSTTSGNLRANESAAQANYGIGAIYYVLRADNTVAYVGRMEPNATELGTAEAVRVTAAATIGSSVVVNTGDRLMIVQAYASIGGTSASGRTAVCAWNGTTSAASGDSFITFAETITEQLRAPAVNFQDPGLLMEGMEQSKWNHLWLPKKLWKPVITGPVFA